MIIKKIPLEMKIVRLALSVTIPINNDVYKNYLQVIIKCNIN